MMGMSAKARAVLSALERCENPAAASEIAHAIAHQAGLGGPVRPAGEAEMVAGRLRRLEAKGLVARTGGKAGNGAICWAITPSGRDALQREESE